MNKSAIHHRLASLVALAMVAASPATYALQEDARRLAAAKVKREMRKKKRLRIAR